MKIFTSKQSTNIEHVSTKGVAALVVDDSEYDAMVSLRALETIGIGHLAHAASGEQAIRILEGGSVDVVLVDHGLPRMSGVELVRTIRSRWPETIIIFVTGSSSRTTAAESIRAGANQYVPKDEYLTSQISTSVMTALRARNALARGSEDGSVSAREYSQATLHWLGQYSHNGRFLPDDPQTAKPDSFLLALCSAYVDESVVSFPGIAVHEEDTLTNFVIEHGVSVWDLLNAFEAVPAGEDEEQQAVHSRIYARLLMRIVTEYQRREAAQAFQPQ